MHDVCVLSKRRSLACSFGRLPQRLAGTQEKQPNQQSDAAQQNILHMILLLTLKQNIHKYLHINACTLMGPILKITNIQSLNQSPTVWHAWKILAKVRSTHLVLINIHLQEDHMRVLCGQFDIRWSNCSAGPAPGGPKVDLK